MLIPELAVTTQKRDCQVIHDSPPQAMPQIGAAAKNRQQKAEGRGQRERLFHTWLWSLHGGSCREKGNYNDERNRGS